MKKPATRGGPGEAGMVEAVLRVLGALALYVVAAIVADWMGGLIAPPVARAASRLLAW
jgi:hypothetical protein